jgi:GDP-D-mannose 3', 5'-epimerase
MKTALVLGAGGFIGSHLVKRLKREGFWVRGVDLKRPRYAPSPADDFIVGDLRLTEIAKAAVDRHFDEVYQLAADMGGAGFVFSGANDADIMHNSAQINLNMLEELSKTKPGVVFYSSSACMYPEHNQLDPLNPNCAEASAYPANPDSEYGWEKLFSERLYLAQKAVGTMAAKKHLQHFVAKLRWQHAKTVRLKCGAMARKRGHFFLLMSAWKVYCG